MQTKRTLGVVIGIWEMIERSAAATGATATALLFCIGEAKFSGETVGVLGAEMDDECALAAAHRFHRKLGDEPVLVFDLHVEVFVTKNGRRFFNDCREFARQEAVICVIR